MTTAHDNVLTFYFPTIYKIQYAEGSFSITDGQPSTLPPQITEKYPNMSVQPTWTITVNCGREASDEMTEGFTNLAPDDRNRYVTPDYSKDSGNAPADINFYFTLLITFTTDTFYETIPLYVAQGGIMLRKPWWLAGPYVLNSCPKGSESAFIFTPSGYVYGVKMGDEYFSFTMWAVSSPNKKLES